MSPVPPPHELHDLAEQLRRDGFRDEAGVLAHLAAAWRIRFWHAAAAFTERRLCRGYDALVELEARR